MWKANVGMDRLVRLHSVLAGPRSGGVSPTRSNGDAPRSAGGERRLAILLLGTVLIFQLSEGQSWVGNVNAPLVIVSHVGLLAGGLLVGSEWAASHLVEELVRQGTG
jgi:hypothetical protein